MIDPKELIEECKSHLRDNTTHKQQYQTDIRKLITALELALSTDFDVIAMLPTKEEIEKEANSYNNSMASIAEASWMPLGFKEGVEWTMNKLKLRLWKY